MSADTVYRILFVLILVTSVVLAILFVNAVAAAAEEVRKRRKTID